MVPDGNIEDNIEKGIKACREAKANGADNACPMEINRLSQLRGRAYENMLAIATCNYPVLHRGCNGHSTLFDGVIYNTETGAPRDMLVSETGDEEGVFLAELDVDMLRKYRSGEIVGLKNRRPELYRLIAQHIEV